MDDWTRHEGSPSPLGVSFIPDEDAYNFALYSKHATSVTLLLFSAQNPIDPIAIQPFDPRRNKSGRIWHCRLPATTVDRATYYAYRVDGPRAPAEGQRFDPEKNLLDPYATAVFFPPGFSREAARHPGPNPGRAPLGVLHAKASGFGWAGDHAPRHTHDTIIYELHVRGFTQRANSGVPADRRGTFAGLIDKIPGSVAKLASTRRNGWTLEGGKPCRTSRVAISRGRSCCGRCAGTAGTGSATVTSSR